ncbi:hypothetical protein ACHAXA_000540 [Cyclostephanos tholiformis]|uniref:BPL/LPL catalytic domain-containing protein n=1 Tax=Cyclostephanos tholiformis TaxID=382380 RepID=A0ABD3SSY7_9STRA
MAHDPLPDRNWAIIGTHEPITNGILRPITTTTTCGRNDVYENNRSCVVVMGIGGKPEKLIDVNAVKNDGVLVLRRFTGGGTVVIDHSSLLTTLIMRNNNNNNNNNNNTNNNGDTSSSTTTTGMDGKTMTFHNIPPPARGTSTSTTTTAGGPRAPTVTASDRTNDDDVVAYVENYDVMPTLRLRENDYVLGDRKIGGNAQCISSGGFLHHTSFLWDWNDENMDYLTLPDKRPSYRGDRTHDEFLVRLRDTHGDGGGALAGVVGSSGGGGGHNSERNSLFRHVKDAMSNSFRLEDATLRDALEIANDKFGDLQGWFDSRCRTRVVSL